MAGPSLDAFYASLIALGCAPCPECDGDYMYPNHTEHRPRIAIWRQPISEVIPESVPEPPVGVDSDAGEDLDPDTVWVLTPGPIPGTAPLAEQDEATVSA